MLSAKCERSDKVKSKKLGHGGDLSMSGVFVRNGIRTVKVWIRGVSESTVSVICHERRCSDFVPFIGHDLFDVGLGDYWVFSDRVLPLMK